MLNILKKFIAHWSVPRFAAASPQSRFFRAIKQHDLETLRALINDEPGWQHFVDAYNEAPLFSLMRHDAPHSMFSLLIRYGAHPLEITRSRPYSPMHLAIAKQRVDILEIMLTSGLAQSGNLRAKDAFGCTVLHTAVIAGDIDMVRLLVSKGARVDIRDNDGLTPLFRAVVRQPHMSNIDRADIIRLLIKANGSTARVLNDANRRGQTMLHVAAENDDDVAIKLLLEAGADSGIEDAQACLPLHLAAQAGHRHTVLTLLNGGARPSPLVAAVTQSGNTALHLAAQYQDDVMNRALLEYGSNVFSQNSLGQTPLGLALQCSINFGDMERGLSSLLDYLPVSTLSDPTPLLTMPNSDYHALGREVLSKLLGQRADNAQAHLRNHCEAIQ